MDSFADAMTQLPLYDKPGGVSRYGCDYTVLGLVISSALHSKGYNMNAAEYLKSRILDPLGLKRTWMSAGQLEPPNDVASKLARGFKPSVSGDSEWIDNTDSEWGASMHAAYTMPKKSYKLAGTLGYGLCGPLSEYVKILKVVLNHGVGSNGVRILSEQTVDYFVKATSNQDVNFNFTPVLGEYLPNGVWGNGVVVPKDGVTQPFNYTSTTRFWGGFYNTGCVWDNDTGYYVIHMSQTPAIAYPATARYPPVANGAWGIVTSTKPSHDS